MRRAVATRLLLFRDLCRRTLPPLTSRRGASSSQEAKWPSLGKDALKSGPNSDRTTCVYEDLIFPKTPQKRPVVLSPEEVIRLIEAAPNLLHRTIPRAVSLNKQRSVLHQFHIPERIRGFLALNPEIG